MTYTAIRHLVWETGNLKLTSRGESRRQAESFTSADVEVKGEPYRGQRILVYDEVTLSPVCPLGGEPICIARRVSRKGKIVLEYGY